MIYMRLITSLKVHMSPKSNIVYSMSRSNSVAPSRRMIGTFNDERDPEYISPDIRTLTQTSRATRGRPKKLFLA